MKISLSLVALVAAVPEAAVVVIAVAAAVRA
jgi:hypothetical protein